MPELTGPQIFVWSSALLDTFSETPLYEIFKKVLTRNHKKELPNSFWTCVSVMPHFFWTMLQRSWYLLYFPLLWIRVAFRLATLIFCLAVVLAESGEKLSPIVLKFLPRMSNFVVFRERRDHQSLCGGLLNAKNEGPDQWRLKLVQLHNNAAV